MYMYQDDLEPWLRNRPRAFNRWGRRVPEDESAQHHVFLGAMSFQVQH